MKTYEEMQLEAIDFLSSVSKCQFSNPKIYNRFKAYRSMHKAGNLPRGGYENIFNYLGYEQVDQWQRKIKPNESINSL